MCVSHSRYLASSLVVKKSFGGQERKEMSARCLEDNEWKSFRKLGLYKPSGRRFGFSVVEEVGVNYIKNG